MRNFREMIIWKEGINLATEIYRITKLFPKEEEYGLKSQIRRAAVSIPSNISEGCSRSSEKEFKRFLEISLGSSFEVETDVILAERLQMIPARELKILLGALQLEQKRINSLVTKIKNDQSRMRTNPKV